MLCEKCGNKEDLTANFYSDCGSPILKDPHGQGTVKNDSPLLVVRPEFVPVLTCLRQTPILVFFCFWSVLSFSTFLSLILEELNINIPGWAIIVSVFLLIAAVVYMAKVRSYAETDYTFYADRLEYVEGFWKVEKKIVEYIKVAETNMVKGVLQKRYGLGTIILATPASDHNMKHSGIRIRDIRNTDEIYQQVRNLIG